MAAKFQDDDGAIAEINIVPFVDIILVVLIIFMVTTPLIMKPSINVNLPKAASGEESTPSLLNITLTKTGEILLNGNASSLEKVSSFAKEQAEKSADSQAVISADKDVSHGDVV
ncbi:MAG: biopolymer transporter ExbD, partial [Bdellovibrionales bacterium]|nr:biopolymer transporter ExbD [Bdellovibrionales bacterium]